MQSWSTARRRCDGTGPRTTTALGVTPRRTGMATHAPRAAVGFALGVVALWSLVLWPDAADGALRDGWWIALVATLAAWKAWLVVTAFRAVR